MNQKSLAALLIMLSIGFPASPLLAEEVDRDKIIAKLEEEIPGLEVEETTVDAGEKGIVVFKFDAQQFYREDPMDHPMGSDMNRLASNILRCLDSRVGQPHSIWMGVNVFDAVPLGLSTPAKLGMGGKTLFQMALIFMKAPALVALGTLAFVPEVAALIYTGNRQQLITFSQTTAMNGPLIVVHVSHFPVVMGVETFIQPLRDELEEMLAAQGRAYRAFPLKQANPSQEPRR